MDAELKRLEDRLANAKTPYERERRTKELNAYKAANPSAAAPQPTYAAPPPDPFKGLDPNAVAALQAKSAAENRRITDEEFAAIGGDPKKLPAAYGEKTVGQKEAEAVQGLVGPDAAGAKVLADTLFKEGSLGRVSSGFDKDGNRIFENQDVLNRYKAIANQYLNKDTRRSADQQAVLNQDRAAMDRYAGPGAGRSADTQGILDRYKANLAGYDNPELNALYETSTRNINQDYASQLSDIRGVANRLRGGAAARMAFLANKQRGNQIRALNTDLFARGADEKRRALDAYAGQVSSTEATEFGRQMDTRNAYATRLGNVENAEYGRLMDTQAAYGSALGGIRADELSRQKLNMETAAQEAAGRYGAYFGGLNLGLQNRQFTEGQNINQQMLDIARQQYAPQGGRGGGGSRRPGGPPAPAGPNPHDQYTQGAIDLINDYYNNR